MKKIGKIIINPEKVIKNEELVNLRGGDYGGALVFSTVGGGYCQYNIPNCDMADEVCRDLCSGYAGTFICRHW